MTDNIKKAIAGLEQYFEAVETMNQKEFDDCYNKLLPLKIDNFTIEQYLKALKEL